MRNVGRSKDLSVGSLSQRRTSERDRPVFRPTCKGTGLKLREKWGQVWLFGKNNGE